MRWGRSVSGVERTVAVAPIRWASWSLSIVWSTAMMVSNDPSWNDKQSAQPHLTRVRGMWLKKGKSFDGLTALAAMMAATPTAPAPKIAIEERGGIGWRMLRTAPAPVMKPQPRGASQSRSDLLRRSSILMHFLERHTNPDWNRSIKPMTIPSSGSENHHGQSERWWPRKESRCIKI